MLTMVNIGCFLVGAVLVSSIHSLLPCLSTQLIMIQCGLGVYASGMAIHNDAGSASFSCANNA